MEISAFFELGTSADRSDGWSTGQVSGHLSRSLASKFNKKYYVPPATGTRPAYFSVYSLFLRTFPLELE